MIRWLWTDHETAPILAAELVACQVRADARSILGLPTGRSAVPMYAHLARLSAEGVVSFRDVTTFNLDEYVGLSESDPASYHAYMKRHFVDCVDVRPERVHIPCGAPENPEAECEAYEEAIRRSGGWDLAVLGLGRNGHIAFNEPGTSPDARTHVAVLSHSTQEANRADFPDGRATPKRAVTVGIGTILEARSIVLLAVGEGKADALERLASEQVDASVPVTLLRGHRDVIVVADHALRVAGATTPFVQAPAQPLRACAGRATSVDCGVERRWKAKRAGLNVRRNASNGTPWIV